MMASRYDMTDVQRDEIVRNIERMRASGKTVHESIKVHGIAQPTYYQWKRSAVKRGTLSDTDRTELEAARARIEELEQMLYDIITGEYDIEEIDTPKSIVGSALEKWRKDRK